MRSEENVFVSQGHQVGSISDQGSWVKRNKGSGSFAETDSTLESGELHLLPSGSWIQASEELHIESIDASDVSTETASDSLQRLIN